ncbi:enoyl-CoA-hydratase DpgB [Streptomyces formicae]|uniref:Enoyl-CoA hydratase/isomerase n=1 Tax=Streptomyces formicae TaxID=1616117 RepID=A0A291QI78_9ACTN|nr:enoyl-CoA-hydratase DpgB [Streptomyces formicae]ATL31292.1 Enoyl-CoA hydratase/isomerase [Streptomyces formicae]
MRLDASQGMAQLTKTLTAFREQAEDERATAAVIELDAGHADGAGHAEWPGPVDVHTVNKWERALRQWERLDAVTLVAASGTCGGPAFDLLLAADVRIAAPDLRVTLPSASGGFWPGMALHRLTHRVGVSGARRLALCMAGAGALDAEQARELGVVDEIADGTTGALDDRLATALADRPARGDVRLLRGLIMDAPGTSFEDALGTHLAACDRALRATGTEASTDTEAPTGTRGER